MDEIRSDAYSLDMILEGGVQNEEFFFCGECANIRRKSFEVGAGGDAPDGCVVLRSSEAAVYVKWNSSFIPAGIEKLEEP